MVRIPDRGSCPLELCILLLFLASRLKNRIKDSGRVPCSGDVSAISSPPVFGSRTFSAPRIKVRKSTGKHVRRKVSGFPDKFDRPRSREFENLAQFETLSETDSDGDYPRTGAIRVNHINYFEYFDQGNHLLHFLYF